jgi:hypothetical protein
MKLHYSDNHGGEYIRNSLDITFYSENANFGIWFDTEDAGWFYVHKHMFDDDNKEMMSDLCGNIDKELLEKMYDRIGKILGKTIKG